MKKTYTQTIWIILISLFIFQGVLENTVHAFRLFDECVGLLCVPLAILDAWKNRGHASSKMMRLRWMQLGLLTAFVVFGLLSNVIYGYQPAWIAVCSAILSVKFFLILLTAGYLTKWMPISLKEQELFFEVIGILWAVYFGASCLLPEMLVMPEAWDICAKSSMLFALLIYCEHKNVWLNRVCIGLMVLMLICSQKEKAYGAIFIFAAMYVLIVKKKLRTKIRYFLYMAVPVVLVAWEKIYYYFVEGSGKFAKSMMTETAVKIAGDYFPLGTGFGTFGSTYAMNYYSPVYALYGLADHPELGEQSKLYLTDMFWPLLLGENGILGTLIYVGVICLLFAQIQRVYFYSEKKYFMLIYMFLFMMMTTFSEAGFMQPAVMIYGFIMGIFMEQYEGKRQQKLKNFSCVEEEGIQE